MTFAALMRVGSMEVIAVLGATAAVAWRPRLRPVAEVGRLVPMALTLTVADPSGSRTLETLVPVTIGRDPESGVVVGDPEVSRSHARLEAEGGAVFLRDLDSRNGTFLNGRPIRSAIEIREGDEIDVGTTRLTVERLVPWT
jgi:pSer/pThr/pTyr-binding forkhead associated (FHA) protein